MIVNRAQQTRDAAALLGLTALAVLVHGYHYGIEDMAVYLPAIKKLLVPSLYPYDANFFLLYIRWTQFHSAVAASALASHLPLEWVIFVWHIASLFLVLLGCLRLARRCFSDWAAQWAGVALVATLLTLPVSGTALFLADQYLHPRTVATAFLLFALCAILDRRPSALLWIVLAALCHPTMAIYGVCHLLIQAWAPLPAAALLPPVWPPGGPANPIWKEVMSHRAFQYPLRWQWYEWLGVVGPIALLVWFSRIARRQGLATLDHISRRLALATSLGVLGAVILTSLPGTLARLEPMRVLHFTYLLFVLFAGGLLGQFVLKARPLRWLALFAPLCLVMFCAQRLEFRASPHIEWPGRPASNAWVEAFDWVRQNTPRNALFALDPKYLVRPGEDFHGFQAIAERSMLADSIKDNSVVEVFPDLAYQWKLELAGRENWKQMSLADLEGLRSKFGVTWVILEKPGMSGLDCPYANSAVMICRISRTR